MCTTLGRYSRKISSGRIKSLLKKYWQKGWFSILITGILFTYLLRLSWLKWGDMIVDIGREMYLPGEISLGKLLYRDVDYIYGPFSPYFNGVLFKLFGTHLHGLIISGIITTLTASILIYKISRFFLNIFFSTFVVLTFLIVFAFGHYVYFGNYNFILPYSYASIHGTVFVLAALYFFNLSVQNKSSRYKYFASLFITFALLTRFEMGIALILAVTGTIIFYAIAFKKTVSGRALFYQIVVYVIAPIFLAGLIYALFLASIKEKVFITNFLDIVLNNMSSQDTFTRWLSGVGKLSENIHTILKSLSGYILLAIFFTLGGLFTNRLSYFKSVFLNKILLWLAGFFFIFIGAFFTIRYFLFDWQYRPMLLFLLAIILMSSFRILKSKDLKVKQENLILLSLSILSFILVLRMLFFVRAGHYGFYILVPGMIIYHIFFLKVIPDFLKTGINRSLFRLGFLAVFIVFIISYFKVSRFCYQNKTLSITTPRGTMYTFNNDRERKCKQLIEYLLQNTNENETLVVFPEGLTINFLAKRKNPLYYYTYFPVQLERREIIEKFIKDMDSKKVDYVVINQRRTDEFGYPAFGKDYAQAIREYILSNYDLLKQFGPVPFSTEEEYGIALFKRKI